MQKEHKILDKSAKILVIEGVSSRRFALIDVLKNLGFEGVKRSAHLSEAIQFVDKAKETPDWILTSLFPEQEINGLSILNKVRRDWRSCRVSLFYEDSQEWCLKKAFELGLFSCHLKVAEMDKTKNSLEELLKRASYWRWEDSLVAADYLRDILKKELKDGKSVEDLLRFERTLLSLFPHAHEPLLIEIATHLKDSGKPKLAVAVLSKVGEFHLPYKIRADQLTLEATSTLEGEDTSLFAQTWEIKRCVLIDPDEASRNLVENALKELGTAEVECYADGNEALTALKGKPEPDLIVQEWRVPKVRGDRLAQMIRLTGFHQVPIIVYSGVVKTSDRFVLREMGISEVIVKPQNQKKLLSLLMQVIEEEKRPKGERAVELRIRKALHTGNVKLAVHLFETHFKPGKTSEKINALLGAEIAFHQGHFGEAENLASQALYLSGEDTLVMNLLGKINLKLGKLDQAENYFSKAEKLAPGNVERLCALAEVKTEGDDISGADALISKAKTFAEDVPIISEIEEKVAVASQDENRLGAAMRQSGREMEVVALLNNRAVGLANRGKFKEGVQLYNKAIKVLPKSMHQFAPTILYNMALAMLKSGGMENEALMVLNKARSYESGTLKPKIESLRTRLQESIDSGEALVLRTSKADSEEPIAKAGGEAKLEDLAKENNAKPMEHGETMLLIADEDLKPGDYCLYKIFTHVSNSEDPKVLSLLKDSQKKASKAS